LKPIAYPRPDAPVEDRRPQARAATPSHIGQNLDLKV